MENANAITLDELIRSSLESAAKETEVPEKVSTEVLEMVFRTVKEDSYGN